MIRADAPSLKSLQLNHGLKDAGYSQLCGSGFRTADAGVTRWVTACFSNDVPSVDEAGLLAFSSALNSFCDLEKGSLPKLHFQDGPARRSPAQNITARERDALCFLMEGHNISQIAYRMGISDTMVHRHLTSSQKKLGARSREQLVVLALRHHIIIPQ